MKKSGFTLAELIITLSIIGIAAALAGPALTKLVPDRNKVTVLRYNALIGNAVNEIYNDERVYQPFTSSRIAGDGVEYFISKDGVNECKGLSCAIGDIPSLLLERIGNDESATITIEADATTGGYKLTLDTNPKKDGKTFSNTLKGVDTFIFKMDEYGRISAGDALTEAYMKNPLVLNDQKNDLASAKKYYKDKKY